MSNYRHFEGEVITKWLQDDGQKDRTMELIADFSVPSFPNSVWGRNCPSKLGLQNSVSTRGGERLR